MFSAVNTTAILHGRMDGIPSFDLKEFKNYYYRLFRVQTEFGDTSYIDFLWVCNDNEIVLFVKSNLQDKFIPMAASKEEGQKFVLNKNDEDFEACRKIICKEDDWKMYTLLLRTSPNKIVKGLCKATTIETDKFEEIKCHRPKFYRVKDILSTIMKRRES